VGPWMASPENASAGYAQTEIRLSGMSLGKTQPPSKSSP
jgi:hypothetical protein